MISSWLEHWLNNEDYNIGRRMATLFPQIIHRRRVYLLSTLVYNNGLVRLYLHNHCRDYEIKSCAHHNIFSQQTMQRMFWWTCKECWKSFKVTRKNFQHFPRRRPFWVIKTTLCRLMPKSWYQKATQSLVNMSLSIFWHNRSPKMNILIFLVHSSYSFVNIFRVFSNFQLSCKAGPLPIPLYNLFIK